MYISNKCSYFIKNKHSIHQTYW